MQSTRFGSNNYLDNSPVSLLLGSQKLQQDSSCVQTGSCLQLWHRSCKAHCNQMAKVNFQWKRSCGSSEQTLESPCISCLCRERRPVQEKRLRKHQLPVRLPQKLHLQEHPGRRREQRSLQRPRPCVLKNLKDFHSVIQVAKQYVGPSI